MVSIARHSVLARLRGPMWCLNVKGVLQAPHTIDPITMNLCKGCFGLSVSVYTGTLQGLIYCGRLKKFSRNKNIYGNSKILISARALTVLFITVPVKNIF